VLSNLTVSLVISLEEGGKRTIFLVNAKEGVQTRTFVAYSRGPTDNRVLVQKVRRTVGALLESERERKRRDRAWPQKIGN